MLLLLKVENKIHCYQRKELIEVIFLCAHVCIKGQSVSKFYHRCSTELSIYLDHLIVYDIFREKNVNLRAEWNENLEVASWKKRIKSENDIIRGELRMAAKATLAVS